MSVWSLNKAYLSAIAVTNIFSEFYPQDGDKNQLNEITPSFVRGIGSGQRDSRIWRRDEYWNWPSGKQHRGRCLLPTTASFWQWCADYSRWKTLHTSQPLYLSELISHYLPPRSLRPSNTNLLTRPAGTTSNFSSRAFSVSAPSIWKSLPAHIRSIDTLSTFKRYLKFHLFQSAFTV